MWKYSLKNSVSFIRTKFEFINISGRRQRTLFFPLNFFFWNNFTFLILGGCGLWSAIFVKGFFLYSRIRMYFSINGWRRYSTNGHLSSWWMLPLWAHYFLYFLKNKLTLRKPEFSHLLSSKEHLKSTQTNYWIFQTFQHMLFFSQI